MRLCLLLPLSLLLSLLSFLSFSYLSFLPLSLFFTSRAASSGLVGDPAGRKNKALPSTVARVPLPPECAKDKCPCCNVPERAAQWLFARAAWRLLEDAEASISRGVELSPRNWRLLAEYALLLDDRGRRSEAETILERSIRNWIEAGGEAVGKRPSLPAQAVGPMLP